MSATVTDDELAAICTSTRAHLDVLLEEPGIARDVVALERIGVALLAAFDTPETPPELGTALIDALVYRGCEASISMLAVLAAFGSKTVASNAAQAARGLADRHEVATGDVGMLTVREVWHSEIPPGEVWVAVLDRPGRDSPQAACVTLETNSEGPIIVDALLTDTGPASELDSGLALLAQGAERSTAQALAECLGAAVANMSEAGLAAPFEAGICLPILARALTGEAHALGRVTTYPELEEEEGEGEDEDELLTVEEATEETLLDALVCDYGRYVHAQYGADSAVWRHGEFISCALLDWKRDYRDGEPANWTTADVEEFMLDFAPRKMTMEDEAIRTLPDCVAAFMGFLDRDRRLKGDTVDALSETCKRLGPKCASACHDPARWGMAKSFAMQMIADGVDLADPTAGEAWIAAHDMRLGAASSDSRGQAQPSKRRAAGGGREKRTAAKQARRRNRR
jgi:hypothetical protein